jgi:hypothetical protein
MPSDDTTDATEDEQADRHGKPSRFLHDERFDPRSRTPWLARSASRLRAIRMEPTAPRSPAVKRWLFNALDILGTVTAASVPAMLAVTSVSRSVNPLWDFIGEARRTLALQSMAMGKSRSHATIYIKN